MAAAVAAVLAATPAQPQSARISGLADVNFGTIADAAQQTSSQDVVVCSYRGQPHVLGYSVTAGGSGPGGAYEITAGTASMAYDVQWADAAGQGGGTMLEAGARSPVFGNAANGFDCPGQSANASLTVTIRAADLASAPGGTYSGTLQITIVPE